MIVCAAIAAAPVLAQDGGRASGFSTTIDTALTYLDSTRTASDVEGRDFITEIKPGLRYASQAGRVRGAVHYGLGLMHHARDASSSEVQHQLSAALTAEVVEKRVLVDLVASIDRRALSAYGQQSISGNRADNPNLAEVGNLSVSPYVSGSLGDAATYSLRMNASATNARRSIVGDSTTTGASASVNSARPGALLVWGLTASSSTTDFRAGNDATTERTVASVGVAPYPDLTFTLRAGRESTDIGNPVQQSYRIWGSSLRWLPTPRTVADFSVDRRFFGRSHAVTFSHRLPLSSFRFTSTRDVTLGNGLAQPQTLYQLFFQQFASQEPDPVLREALVLNFLGGQGQDPGSTVGGAFVVSRASLQERHDLAWSYAAKRLTLALQAFTNRSGLLGDSLVTPEGEDVRQRGYNATAAYRITPTASLGLNGSRTMTKPSATQAGTDLKSLALTFSDRLGPRATASLSARYTVFNSALNPYREVALAASLAMRF